MRIVHMPYNVASFASETVQALRSLGYNASGIIFQPHVKSISSDGVKTIPLEPGNFISFFRKYFFTIKYILRADVVHWYWDADLLTSNFELKLIKWLGKPAVIEWVGSDIRNPQIEFSDNPWYKQAFNDKYEFASTESHEKSVAKQKKFAAAGFIPVVCPDMEQYLRPEIFPHYFKTHQRLNIKNYTPQFPSAQNKKPLIVHSSTAPYTKGTQFVLEAIQLLKNKFDFDFELIENKTRAEALNKVLECDIYLDQFILGCHGMAATEAMAMGKPVVGYIKEALLGKYPADLPIINASPIKIAEQLTPLLHSAELRNTIGKKSRAYAEKYHDAQKVAQELADIYKQVICEKIKS